ncbi:MAG: ABC transporter ATP-binding protein [Deltaproteobacteria bacterium]|nr:ABC transporter ATP-binding protein [Deltaproteobacteria bacterium]
MAPRNKKTTTLPQAAPPMIRVEGLAHSYGTRKALDGLNLSVAPGQAFALLGPNGSGKSTLFRILSTVQGFTSGLVEVDGLAVQTQPAAVRTRLGVVFQYPSLDGKLTARENLRFQGYLYGFRGTALTQRVSELLHRFKLESHAEERVDALSGGMRRRVELAKTLLHSPRLLLLDEPSTGLDPAARRDLWTLLNALRKDTGLTLLVATHLMDEAAGCDRVGLMDQGRMVAQGTPDDLCRELGGEVVSLDSPHPEELARVVKASLKLKPKVVNGTLRLEGKTSLAQAARIMDRHPELVTRVTLARPTLEDVFLARTGHRLNQEEA